VAALAGPRDVMVFYPGAPGSPEEAKDVMASFGAYLAKAAGLPEGALKVVYENDLETGLADIAKNKPGFAIVGLPVYLSQSAKLKLAANGITGVELRRERIMMLFRLAQAARDVRNETRAIQAYDEIIHLAQGSAEIRAEGLARALRGELVCERGSYREGLEQMLLGLERLRTVRAPEIEVVINRAAHYGGYLPRKEYERMIQDLTADRDIRHRLLGDTL
jgi:hypothetical protein